MILRTDSILNFLSPKIEKRTLLILDAIRFTIQMIDESWIRLNESLLKYSQQTSDKNLPDIFLDTWSIVDSSQRFFNLYKMIHSESNHQILDSIKHIKSFRNTFEHLDERIDESLLNSVCPFWGALRWKYKNKKIKRIETFLAISGINYGSEHKINVVKYENTEDLLIYNIQIETVDKKGNRIILNLDELVSSILKIIEILEITLEAQSEKFDLKKHDWSLFRDTVVIFHEPLDTDAAL
ncbi:MAG: hypothetical protein H6Q17_2102 [Bacteroidetes bacterium]|nr:hypothetical protein [Bacteroidota bacterium]